LPLIEIEASSAHAGIRKFAAKAVVSLFFISSRQTRQQRKMNREFLSADFQVSRIRFVINGCERKHLHGHTCSLDLPLAAARGSCAQELLAGDWLR
jgi:hypothetical protein